MLLRLGSGGAIVAASSVIQQRTLQCSIMFRDWNNGSSAIWRGGPVRPPRPKSMQRLRVAPAAAWSLEEDQQNSENERDETGEAVDQHQDEAYEQPRKWSQLPGPLGLPPRLQAVAALVPLGKSMAEIGAHDARLCLRLLESGHVPKAVAIELEERRLVKAQEAADCRFSVFLLWGEHRKALALRSKLSLRVGSGLLPLAHGEVSTVVLAGMGGKTIIEIVSEAATHGCLEGIERFILQPMKDVAEVRAFFASSWAFSKVSDDVVVESSRKRRGKLKIYSVLAFDSPPWLRATTPAGRSSGLNYAAKTSEGEQIYAASNSNVTSVFDRWLSSKSGRKCTGRRAGRKGIRPMYPVDLLPPLRRLLEAHAKAGAVVDLQCFELVNGCLAKMTRNEAELQADQSPMVWYAKKAMPRAMAESLRSDAFMAELDRFLVPAGNVSTGCRYHAVFFFRDVDGGRQRAFPQGEGDFDTFERDGRFVYKFGGQRWDLCYDAPPRLLWCRELVARLTGAFFNGAVVNVYNTTRAEIGWHADSEYHLGPLVATLSVGRPHDIGFRTGTHRRGTDRRIELEDGSLLVMGAGVQEALQHRVFKADPRQRQMGDCRISITFHHHRLDVLRRSLGV